MAAVTGYSRTQIILHWLTAITVIAAWLTHDSMEEIARSAWRAGDAPVPTVHTVLGVLAFVLVAIRLILRRRMGVPEPEGDGFQAQAAVWGHRALYALTLLAPLVGVVTWFGGVRSLADVHALTANALMLVALGHAAMAIWHQYAKKDGTLTRMLKVRQ